MQVPIAQGGTMELITNGQAWIHVIVLSNELNTPKVLFCPEENGKDKIMANSFGSGEFPGATRFTNDINLSYFVGLDADDRRPRMWLSGDANLGMRGKALARGFVQVSTNDPVTWQEPRHEKNRKGYLLFADGSVQSASALEVRDFLKTTGVATNRLAMP
jgi:hypothetical protein